MFTPTIDGDSNNICHRVGGKFSSLAPSLEVILVGIDDDLPLFLALLEWLAFSFTGVLSLPLIAQIGEILQSFHLALCDRDCKLIWLPSIDPLNPIVHCSQ